MPESLPDTLTAAATSANVRGLLPPRTAPRGAADHAGHAEDAYSAYSVDGAVDGSVGSDGSGGVQSRQAGRDVRWLTAVRDRTDGSPAATAAARALSLAGEHAALWLALSAAGAAASPGSRRGWLRGAAVIGAAHLAGMGVKRAVRRPRPRLPGREALVRTSGRHSFPSSHAASAAAAAVVLPALLPSGGAARCGALALGAAAGAMCLSRLAVGVHYPSDVAAGAALGAALAAAGRGWILDTVPASASANAPETDHG